MAKCCKISVLSLSICLVVLYQTVAAQDGPYYGVEIKDFSSFAHNVQGKVYALNNKQLFIKGMTYDGTGPDAFFYVGATGRPSGQGLLIPDENNSQEKLGYYNNQDIVLNLPDNMEMSDLKWISVWCRAFAANFGEVIVPSDFEAPRPYTVTGFPAQRFNHNVKSGRITFLNEKTIMIEDFHYDGGAPDVFFLVGTTPGAPSADTGIVVPDENGSSRKLSAYSGQTVVLTLPGDITVFDLRWISIYCKQAHQNFGSITVPTISNLPSSQGFLVGYWWYYLAYGFYPGYWNEI